MENTTITVFNPCNKDWNNMTPENNGKHCGACNKTVIDFTTWEVEEIKKYLQGKNQNVCGHFKTLQVAVKRPKHHQFLVELYFKTDNKFKTPYFKSVVLLLIVFCMTIVGCNTPTTGEVSTPEENQTTIKENPTKSGEDNKTTTGNVSMRIDTPSTKLKPKKNK